MAELLPDSVGEGWDPVFSTTDHTDHTDQRQDVYDPRDYDVEHYVRVLREHFADRLSRALTPEAFPVLTRLRA